MGSYTDQSDAVARTFVAALDPYVRDVVRSRGLDDAGLDEALASGTAWLTQQFESWRTAAPEAQISSPLELFRESLQFPTAALVEAGATPVARDDQQVAALPGDLLDMAPATSQQLGEAAFEAHIAWGRARAGTVAGIGRAASPAAPAEAHGVHIALVGSNLMDRTRIDEIVSAAGADLVIWRNPAAVDAGLGESATPALALVDLNHPSAQEAIADLAAAGVRTVAFGPHVDDHALAAALSLGASDALPRSRFFARLSSLLPDLV